MADAKEVAKRLDAFFQAMQKETDRRPVQVKPKRYYADQTSEKPILETYEQYASKLSPDERDELLSILGKMLKP